MCPNAAPAGLPPRHQSETKVNAIWRSAAATQALRGVCNELALEWSGVDTELMHALLGSDLCCSGGVWPAEATGMACLRPAAGDPPAEMATSDTEEVDVLEEAEEDHAGPHSAASPPANASADHAPDPAADNHDGNGAEGVSGAHTALATAAAAPTNGVAHATDAASPQARSRPQQQSSDSDDDADDDLPLNARLLRETPSDAAAAQGIAGRRRQQGTVGSPDEGLQALGSVDSAAGMADAVISTVTGTSSVAAAAGAFVSCRRVVLWGCAWFG